MPKYDNPLKRLRALAEGENGILDMTEYGITLFQEDLRKVVTCLDAVERHVHVRKQKPSSSRSHSSRQMYLHAAKDTADKVEQTFDALLRDEPVIPECVQLALTRADELNALFSKAYGEGFVWELGHSELWATRGAATPLLNISLFTNVTRGGNDVARRWPSESKIVEGVEEARSALNRSMAMVVDAGFVVRLAPVQNGRPNAETVEVTVLKKH